MEPQTLDFLARASGGRLVGGDPGAAIHGITTDSRAARPGWAFLALIGERFDGRRFASEAVRLGAAAVIMTPGGDTPAPSVPWIEVDDARRAYGAIAAAYRRLFSPVVAAVAGSNGKTSVKELAAAAIGASRRVVRSAASHNNDVGVPASLLLLDGACEAAVFEAGTNHPGELAPLLRMIQPRIGVLASIGREHLEHFGDLAGVAEEEGALAEALPAAADGGVFIMPDDAPCGETIARRARARILRFGFSASADWRGRVDHVGWDGVRFHVDAPAAGWSGPWRLPVPARHMAANALGALAAAAEAGADPGAARAALARFSGAPRRMAVREAAGVRILDDSYNANADSLLAALHALAELPCAGRRVAVIGDMAELGPHADDAHAEGGRTAARLGFDAVWGVGRRAATTASAAGPALGRAFDNADDATAALACWLAPGDAVLVKASRSSRLDALVDALLAALVRTDGVETSEPASRAA